MQYKFLTLLTFLTIINFEGCERLFQGKDIKRISVTSSYNIGEHEILVTEKGEYLYFGEYPQSIVLDENLENELNKLNLDNNEIGHYNNEKYIKYITDDALELYDNIEYYNTVKLANEGNIEYYKFEPILWRIISKDETSLTLASFNVLDGRYLMDLNNIYAYDENNKKIFVNDLFDVEEVEEFNKKLEYFKCSYNVNTNEKICYSNSDLKYWLNDYFYMTSFNDEEKEIMECVYDEDYVSLPSKEDVDSSIKVFQATDYCKSTGVKLARNNPELRYNASYLLNDNINFTRVNTEGVIESGGLPYQAIYTKYYEDYGWEKVHFRKEGIKPVIKIKIN